MSNTYIFEPNTEINFQELTEGMAPEAVKQALETAASELNEIKKQKTVNCENTLLAFDNAINKVSRVYGTIYLVAFTHTDATVRVEAQQSIPEFESFFTEIQLDEELYKALKKFAATSEAHNLEAHRAKFLNDSLVDFERNGLALNEEKREEVKQIKNELSECSSAFDANIASYTDCIVLSENEVGGLPDDYLKSRLQDDGSYKIDLSYPSYKPFMKYSTSAELRKKLLVKFLNRAHEQNNELLKRIIDLRFRLAKSLGYSTYAEYNLTDKMAKSASKVWDFENDLLKQVRPKAQRDYDELLAQKKSDVANAKIVNSWDSAYYENRLLLEKYEVDEQQLKQYFELNTVLDGLFSISSLLFGVDIEKQETEKCWHNDVNYYAVKEGGCEIGHFYLDLFPRENKYGHAAMFPIVAGKKTGNYHETPKAALVCNFPQPTSDTPSLLTHTDVETLFHEFGHLLHGVLTATELSSQSGTSVSRDFVETPSQLFEQWAWNYDSLQQYAVHYQTKEILPKELHHKMVAAKNVNSGNAYLQQIYYGCIDMTLHDKWEQNKEKELAEILEELQNSITLFSFVEGTNMQSSFGHLNGYAAGYYGYLWSKVYAEDFFSIFDKQGVLNPKMGRRYRDLVLATGGSIDPAEIVESFLGREPNAIAFAKNIGIAE